jgi:hypothetical protein
MKNATKMMAPVDLVAAVLDMATSHVEDIENGIEDGLYEASENTDLDDKRAAIGVLGELVATVQTGDSNGIRPMLDASTAHLSAQDRMILDRAGTSRIRDGFPRTVNHEHGWLLFLTGDGEGQAAEVAEAKARGASEGLLALMQRGHAAGAYILNFDQDADVVDGVPILDEESQSQAGAQ